MIIMTEAKKNQTKKIVTDWQSTDHLDNSQNL